MIFDSYGYMAASCDNQAKVYLNYVNGTYAGLYIGTQIFPHFISWDYFGHLIVITQYQISVYY